MGSPRPVLSALLLALSACTSASTVASTSAVATTVTTESDVALTTTTTTTTATPSMTTSTMASEARFEYVGTVLESPDHGPEACAGVILTSLPPLCSGIPVPNFDWDLVPWAEEAQGTTWAEVLLTGHFDGAELALIRAPQPIPAEYLRGHTASDFTPPCDEPPGGWSELRSQDFDNSAASTYAVAQEDFAGSWIYRPQPNVDRVVAVFTFTGNIPVHTEHLDTLYDGALCVGLAARSLIELEAIREELRTLLHSAEARDRGIYPGFEGFDEGHFVFSGISVTSSTVGVTVWAAFDPDAAKQWLDSLYGEGAVELTTTLVRVDP